MENKQTVFIFDDSSLARILEDTDKESREIFNKARKLKEKDKRHKLMTTSASILRAIDESSEIASMSRLKDILDTVEIYPGKADFKNEEETRNEIIHLANTAANHKQPKHRGIGG